MRTAQLALGAAELAQDQAEHRVNEYEYAHEYK
jgi:hypothetical protein